MIDRSPHLGKEPTVPTDGEMTPDPQDDLDTLRANDAEVVRRALVRLRGGAPFLSSRDATLLVQWLDDGVPVARILRGLETAADKRRASRQRLPLCLTHAKRYLGVPRSAGLAPVAADDDHPMAPMASFARAPDPALDPALAQLVAELTALPCEDPDQLADVAADRVVAFFDRCWNDLGATGQARYLDKAHLRMADVLEFLDEATQASVIEEHARGLLRADFPNVSVTTVLTLLHR